MHPQHFYWLCVCACVRLCECIGTFGSFPDDSGMCALQLAFSCHHLTLVNNEREGVPVTK